MNSRIVARDPANEAPHSLNERVARFAIAINGCSAQGVSKSHWEQANRELTSEPDLDPKIDRLREHFRRHLDGDAQTKNKTKHYEHTRNQRRLEHH